MNFFTLVKQLTFVSLLSGCLWAEEQAAGKEVDKETVAFFDQKIHPILEKKCFVCHGVEKLEGNLALTSREELIKGGTRGPSINVENPPESVLMKMINNEDLKQRMPFQQPELSAAEKDALLEWIKRGAPYNPDREFESKVKAHAGEKVIDDEARSYWAYQKPKKAEVPALKDASIKNAIDSFIAEELNKEGIPPNTRAEAKHLLRRVYYDLTGLPPSIEALDAFAKAPQTQEEWKKVLEQLMASPHYGERMAILWLDLVRYAETNAFERDSEKPFIWRYRDYVINAFNSNMPYNRFITEQLAGDEVENATFDSHIATGYLALMQRDDEPADRPQSHADMISEMVDVTGEAFLGSTLGCAKCHDHKGDPIRQADYFSMMAFFDPIAQTQLKQAAHHWKDPAAHADMVKQRDAKQAEMKQLLSTVDLSKLAPYTRKLETPPPGIIPLSTNQARQDWQYSYKKPNDLNWNQPSYGGNEFKAVKLPLHIGPRQPPYNVQASAWDGKEVSLYLRKDFALTAIPERMIFYATANTQKLTIYINGVQVFDGAPLKVQQHDFYPFSQNDMTAFTTGKNTIGIYVEARPHPRHINPGLFTSPITEIDPQHYIQLFPTRAEALLGKPFLDKFKPLNNEVNHLRGRANNPGHPYMSQRENKHVEVPKIHIRGNVHAEGKVVPLAVPAVMVSSNDKAQIPVVGDFEKNGSHGRRLALAKWISSKDNPLTARVMVNRLWQHCFGVGIVPSSNDFGTLGEDPTNQKLLDWLATEFMESGWDIKHMLTLMLSSDTYQRSTAPNELAMKSDPMNQLHWRHSPRRLSAEEIRDSFLAVTNELQLQKPKAPFVRPEMPEAVLATSSQPARAWPPTKGPEANSRSVYIHVKRSIKLPMLSSFDAPERDMSCASRFATTVPTQALTMLNSKFINERAAKFAARISAQHPENIDQQMSYAFQLATGRAAEDPESKELKQLYQELTTDYKLSPADALNRVCLLMLNLNEMIYLD